MWFGRANDGDDEDGYGDGDVDGLKTRYITIHNSEHEQWWVSDGCIWT